MESNNKRAKQFMPFNSLTGYFDLILEAQKIKEDKRDLTEDELEDLNKKIHMIKKGTMIKIKHYDTDSYVIKEGIVTSINLEYRYITVIKERIFLDNILFFEIL